jgi:hypothetical protein
MLSSGRHHPPFDPLAECTGDLLCGSDRVLDDAQPSATPAQPEALSVSEKSELSALSRMVSRVGIEPTTRRLRVRLGGVRWVPSFLFTQENR